MVLLMVVSFGASSQEFGYLITINDTRLAGSSHATQSLKSPSLDEAQNFIFDRTGIKFDLSKVFIEGTPFFESKVNGFNLYCEKKELVKRMDGSFAYKRIKLNGQKADQSLTNDEQMAQSFVNFGDQPEESKTEQEGTETTK